MSSDYFYSKRDIIMSFEDRYKMEINFGKIDNRKIGKLSKKFILFSREIIYISCFFLCYSLGN